MNLTSKVTSRVANENREIVESEKDSSSTSNKMTDLANDIFAKYPLNSKVTKLNSTLEIKQNWLFNEWTSECQFSKYICLNFPCRGDLDPENQNPNIDLIQSTFYDVRGKWAL